MTCKHEPHIPTDMSMITDFCVMNLGNAKIHMCKKCNLLYWEEI